MTITRVKPAGWGSNEQLTSAQQTAVDINATNAVDKRVGQTDTVASSLTFSGTNSHSGAETFDNITATGATHYKVASRSITRQLSCVGASDYHSGLDWTPRTGGLQQQVNSSGTLLVNVDLPDGCTLTAIKLWIKPTTGHVGLPAFMPSFILYRETAAGVSTTVTSATDASGSVGVYEAQHSFGSTGLNEAVDRSTMRYAALISGEGSTNFLANLALWSIEITFTSTRVDEAAA